MMRAAGEGKIAVAVPRLLPAIMGMRGGGSRGNYREGERNRSREPPLLSLGGQL